MSKLNLASKIGRNMDVVSTQIDNDLVMMKPDDTLFFGVNTVGTTLWTLLENNTLPLSTLCDMIHDDYDVDKTQCINDVTAFVEAMVAENLLFVVQ